MQASNNTSASTPFTPTPAAQGSVGGGTPGSGGGLSNNSLVDDKANTPGKMFTQTPPAGRRLDENGRPILVNRSSRRRRTGTSPVSTLPAIPPKNSYSYGSVSTGAMSYIRYADTSNSLKELMQEAGQKGSGAAANVPSIGADVEDVEISEHDEALLPGDEEPPDLDLASEHGSVKTAASGRKKPKPLTQEELDAASTRKGSLRSSRSPDHETMSTTSKGRAVPKIGRGKNTGKKPAPPTPAKTKLNPQGPAPARKPPKPPSTIPEENETQPNMSRQDKQSDGDTTLSQETAAWNFWDTLRDQSTWIVAVWNSFWRKFNALIKNTGELIGQAIVYVWFLCKEPLRAIIPLAAGLLLLYLVYSGSRSYLEGNGLPIPNMRNFANYIPGMSWARFRSGARYIPPTGLPEDFHAIAKRLSNVEQVLQMVSDEGKVLQEDFQKKNKEYLGQLQYMSKSIGVLSEHAEEVNAHTKTQIMENAMATSQINVVGKKFEEVRTQLENFEKQLKDLQNQDREITEKTYLHGGLIQGLRAELESLLPKIEDMMAKNRRLERALNHLQKSLPDTLPVRVDTDGKLSVRPEFYQYLKDFYRSEIGDLAGGKDSTESGSRGPYTWDEFLRVNEVNLKSYLGRQQKEWWASATKDEVVVSKERFMTILKEDIMRLDQKLSGKIKIQESKIRKEITNQVNTGVKNLERELMKMGGGKKSLGENLADTLYQNYATRLVDYAAFASGALVDPFRQSPTFSNKPRNRFFRTVEWLFRGDHKVPRAKIVLTSTAREPGLCWPFPGKQGHIGIILAQDIYPTDVTVEHIAFGASTFKDTAPKAIDFWVQVTNATLRDDLYKAAKQAMKLPEDAPLQPQPPRATNMNDYVKVATFTYQWGVATPIVQTFSIPLDLMKMGVSTDHVLFSVTDNYGNEEFTCLYRLRVHGTPVGPPQGTKVVEGTRELD